MRNQGKILVAGGAGYVGAALVPALLERGYEVHVVDAGWFGWTLPEGAVKLERDLFLLTEEDVAGFDAVIFLAGLSNDPMAEFSPALNFIFNAASPAYLGYVARRAGVRRFIFAGSCSVYGYAVDQFFDETMPTVSNYPYGISKIQAEQSLIQLADDRFSVISLRKGTISGYSPRMRLDLIVNTMFRTALETGVIRINNPAIWRPILSIQDAVGAYIRALEANGDVSGVFNIASGNYTVGEVADIVKEELETLSGQKIRLDIHNVQDYRNYKVTCDKAVKILSFKPAHDVRQIVRDLYGHRDAFADFDNPAYRNIEIFTALVKSGQITSPTNPMISCESP